VPTSGGVTCKLFIKPAVLSTYHLMNRCMATLSLVNKALHALYDITEQWECQGIYHSSSAFMADCDHVMAICSWLWHDIYHPQNLDKFWQLCNHPHLEMWSCGYMQAVPQWPQSDLYCSLWRVWKWSFSGGSL